MKSLFYSFLFLILVCGIQEKMISSSWSDEGMWLFNKPPIKQLKERYRMELTQDWLDHARLSSIRFNNGGSGSFVSANGLIITNHHIGADSLQKLSTANNNLLERGFYAAKREQELRCPDLELNVLESIEDVTERVNAKILPTMSSTQANTIRRATMSEIEKESLERTKLRSDIVTLYQGGQYHLYRYRKYTDVRLVMAPEQSIAFFGGDTDNFEFPRYNLDICLFRAYENDKPVKPKHYLKFSSIGPQENDLVFVVGNPGTTNRLETYEQLQHRRDYSHPYFLNYLRTMEAKLIQHSENGIEDRRQASSDLRRFSNARKAISGQYLGLLDPSILRQKQITEFQFLDELRHSLARSGKQEIPYTDAKVQQYLRMLDKVRLLHRHLRSFEKEYYLLERGDGFNSRYFQIARQIVRLTAELKKPSSDRLREYRDSNLDSLKFQLFSPAPIYPEVEKAKMLQSLTFMAEQLGGDHPLIQLVLDGHSPIQVVERLIGKTRLGDSSYRKELVKGGWETVLKSDDPMIQFARYLDERARKIRSTYENEFEEPERQVFGEMARLRFEVKGDSIPPDATFTLRLAFGVVKGYQIGDQSVPYCTKFSGIYKRAEEHRFIDPFNLPETWLHKKEKINLDCPFNFVSTADTIGGNSGSPVLNRAGEFVGINFDRNRFGLIRNFVYTDHQARHVAVHSQAILEALKNVYGYEELVQELIPIEKKKAEKAKRSRN